MWDKEGKKGLRNGRREYARNGGMKGWAEDWMEGERGKMEGCSIGKEWGIEKGRREQKGE